MHLLSIDAGSYSIKYISSFVDKRNATHVEMKEIVLTEAMLDHPEWETQDEATQQLMKRIVDEVARPDTRIVLHVPPEGVTTRFLTLPVKNRKKAELMIPFQLEEDIPYALFEAHYAWALETGRTQSLALVALTRDADFSAFHERLAQWSSPPAVLTTEPSVMDAFYGQNPMSGPYCVLDMGHRSTKAYFFYNSKLIATHVAYVGGRHVDEMVAQTYGISAPEAVNYKHQNSFVLTTAQTGEVDENQREFARLMDQVFRPLVTDFSRWELGFRVTHGVKISQVFLCGGTANVKNMANYLTEKFGIKASLLETFEGVDLTKVDVTTKARAKFTLANMMAITARTKGRLINLLTGRYAQAGRSDLPLHALAFVTTRAAAVTAVLAVLLVIEGVMLELDVKAVNAKLTTMAKNPTLGLTVKERRNLTTDPKTVDSLLSKRLRSVRQQISTLQSAADIKALSPLVTVSAAAVGSPAMLSEFTVADNGDVRAAFTAADAQALKDLKPRLEALPFSNLNVQLDDAANRLTVTGVQ